MTNPCDRWKGVGATFTDAQLPGSETGEEARNDPGGYLEHKARNAGCETVPLLLIASGNDQQTHTWMEQSLSVNTGA